MKTFLFPTTPTCRINYVREGVKYQGVLTTPKTDQELLAAMSVRHARVDQITTIEPIEPRQEFLRHSPAYHKVVKYAALSEQQ